MKLYVAVVQAQRDDPKIRVFSQSGPAILWARTAFRETVDRIAGIDEYSSGLALPWLWEAVYGEEGAHAWVEEATLDLP